MREVVNVLGISLILFGIIAVIFISLNYADDSQTAIVQKPIEAPQIQIPDVKSLHNEIHFVLGPSLNSARF